jgi:hypothetical protein
VQARRLLFVAPRRVGMAAVDVPGPGSGRLPVRAVRSATSRSTEPLCYRGLLEPDLPLDETIGSLGGTARRRKR